MAAHTKERQMIVQKTPQKKEQAKVTQPVFETEAFESDPKHVYAVDAIEAFDGAEMPVKPKPVPSLDLQNFDLEPGMETADVQYHPAKNDAAGNAPRLLWTNSPRRVTRAGSRHHGSTEQLLEASDGAAQVN